MSTISEQAIASSRPPIAEMPEQERSISERFRIVAKAWVEADKAASLREECKTATLSQLALALNEKSVAAAEQKVKASPEWMEYLRAMVEARADANLKKVQLEYLRILEREMDRSEWMQRTERKMGRQAT